MKQPSLTLPEFRRRIVAGSFPEYRSLARAVKGLRFVQADPIRAPARAQDLILRHRVADYRAGDLEKHFPRLAAEEGYLFAYGFMTPEVWNNLRFRPRGKLKKLEREVLETVAELGEVHPRRLDDRFGGKSVQNYWGGKSKETKRVLEDLHHHGFLRVSRRENGIRVYAVPEDDRELVESSEERYRSLLLTTAQVFGPATRSFLLSELRSQNHLVPQRRDRSSLVDSLVKSGQLMEVDVAGETYLWNPKQWASNEVPHQVRILAPFDPLVRDRDRFTQLWGWIYRFEAYVPAAKRERGYYAMPVLWKDLVIGWANADVTDERLSIKFGYVSARPKAKEFQVQAKREVQRLGAFLGLPSDAVEFEF